MSTRLLTASEVASMLGVPRSWVYEQSRRGLIPMVELERYRRFREGGDRRRHRPPPDSIRNRPVGLTTSVCVSADDRPRAGFALDLDAGGHALLCSRVA